MNKKIIIAETWFFRLPFSGPRNFLESLEFLRGFKLEVLDAAVSFCVEVELEFIKKGNLQKYKRLKKGYLAAWALIKKRENFCFLKSYAEIAQLFYCAESKGLRQGEGVRYVKPLVKLLLEKRDRFGRVLFEKALSSFRSAGYIMRRL